MKNILCLDPGTAHTGLAISYEGEIATPLDTIFERDVDKLIGRLIPFLVRFGPEKVIIGVPESGPLKSTAREIGEKIKKIYLGEVTFYDESLSSAIAQNLMKQNKKTIFDRKTKEHQTAAAVILQDYLDSL